MIKEKNGVLLFLVKGLSGVAVIFGAIFWLIEMETPSNASFNGLKTRVTVLEENMPEKGAIAKIQINQAAMAENQEGMKAQLQHVIEEGDRIMEKIMELFQNKQSAANG